MKATRNLIAFALSMTGASAFADDTSSWKFQPRAAYFAAFSYYCAPVQVALATATEEPAGNAARVYKEVLLGRYEGDCRAFYLNEVVRRIDVPTQQGMILVEW